MTAGFSLNENTRWIVAENSFCALDQIDSIIRTRRTDVMLQHDRTAFGGFNDAGVVIAGLVDLFPLRVAGRYVVFAVSLQSEMSRAHRDNVVESVATIDRHILRHWAKSMGGIEIAVAQNMMSTPPKSLILILKQDLAQVMVVCALTVYEISKHAGTDHAQHCRF